MKMVYERPLMKAQVFAVNNYVAACTDPNLLADVDTSAGTIIDLNKRGFTSVIDYNNRPTGIDGFDLTHIFEQINKQEMYSYADGYEGDKQYVWSATGNDGKTYYLEYSAEWNDLNTKGGSIFVLYQETAGSAHSDAIDIDWGSFGGTLYQQRGYDTVICGIHFADNKVYWSN